MLLVRQGPGGDLPKGGESPPSPGPLGRKAFFLQSRHLHPKKKPQNFYQLFLPHRTGLFFVNSKQNANKLITLLKTGTFIHLSQGISMFLRDVIALPQA